MTDRRQAMLLAAAAPHLALANERTRTALISDPTGPHLGIYTDALSHPAVEPVAVADTTGGIFSAVTRAVEATK
jgi:hypothetical protein